MASYVLLIHGQGKARFQLGIHYVVINLLASALFLIGLGLIYASVGSLNMADVARFFQHLPPIRQRWLRQAAIFYLLCLRLRQQFCLWAFGCLKPMPLPAPLSRLFSR
jgi:formate hydrogenlyase subunit 3/multisubunit Na+/H+ antiporter MnhD subunit